MIDLLPADTTLEHTVGTLQYMERNAPAEPSAELEAALPKGDAWELRQGVAGTMEMPAN